MDLAALLTALSPFLCTGNTLHLLHGSLNDENEHSNCLFSLMQFKQTSKLDATLDSSVLTSSNELVVPYIEYALV